MTPRTQRHHKTRRWQHGGNRHDNQQREAPTAPFLAADRSIHGEQSIRWLERIPYTLLIVAALFMLGAPFAPEPHLIEKARMLVEGQLTRPLSPTICTDRLRPWLIEQTKLYFFHCA